MTTEIANAQSNSDASVLRRGGMDERAEAHGVYTAECYDKDGTKKAELLRRLELARQAKEAKKSEQQAKEKQRLDNLKKARRALKRKRNA